MKVYEYSGIDKAKKAHNGTIKAESGEMALFMLMKAGIYPTDLIELSSSQQTSHKRITNLKSLRDKLSNVMPVDEKYESEEKPKANHDLLKFSVIILVLVGMVIIGSKLLSI